HRPRHRAHSGHSLSMSDPPIGLHPTDPYQIPQQVHRRPIPLNSRQVASKQLPEQLELMRIRTSQGGLTVDERSEQLLATEWPHRPFVHGPSGSNIRSISNTTTFGRTDSRRIVPDSTTLRDASDLPERRLSVPDNPSPQTRPYTANFGRIPAGQFPQRAPWTWIHIIY